MIDPRPGFAAPIGRPGLHGPLVVIDRAVPIDQVPHEMQGAVAPINSAEVAEKAGVDRSAAEVQLQPAPAPPQAVGRGIDDREPRTPLFPGFVELDLLCGERALLVEGAPQGAQLQLGQVAEALVNGAAPAQAAEQLLDAAQAAAIGVFLGPQARCGESLQALPGADDAELQVGAEA